MFLLTFWRKKESEPDPIDKITQQFSQIFYDQVDISVIKQCYKQIGDKLTKGWPAFKQKYQRETLKIKKSEGSWNYNDESIIRNRIRKSMVSQSMSVLSATWCNHINLKLIQDNTNKMLNNNQLQQKTIQNLLKLEIHIFCSSIFKYAIKLYKKLFMKCYKSKLKYEQKYGQIIIQEEVKQIFQDFIRNTLTESQHFYVLYNNSILPCLSRKILKVDSKILVQKFEKFLKNDLQIQEFYTKVYMESGRAIWQFHSESNIISKILKSTQIIPAIEKDHLSYYNRNRIPVVNRAETITTKLLKYLFLLYCPSIQASIKYMRLMICYRFSDSQVPQYQALLEIFCFLWTHEDTSANLNVILDAFQYQS